jgi:hypothetical protein
VLGQLRIWPCPETRWPAGGPWDVAHVGGELCGRITEAPPRVRCISTAPLSSTTILSFTTNSTRRLALPPHLDTITLNNKLFAYA